MNHLQTNINVWAINVLYKATMELYADYFRKLELASKYASNKERAKIRKLKAVAENCLKDDLNVFATATKLGPENLERLNGILKIHTLIRKS